MRTRHTPAAALAIAVLSLLAGCQDGSDGSTGGVESTRSAQAGEEHSDDAASTEDATAAMPEHGEPTGFCGDADVGAQTAVYLGDAAITCPQALELAGQVADGKGTPDASTDGMSVGEWSCGYGFADDPDPAYSMICWRDEAKKQAVLFRPTELDVQPGFHRNPHDFERSDGLHFTTPAARFFCSISHESMGCDAHQGWPSGVPEVEDEEFGGTGEPTAIVFDGKSEPKFAIFGDPAYTGFDDRGGIDGANPVLGYGEVLYYAGFSCTADEQRGVVCQKGGHGFEMSSKTFRTS